MTETTNPVLTVAKLAKIASCSDKVAETHLPSILEATKQYDIQSLLRLSAFLAQIIHETGSFKDFEENLNYSASALEKTFPSHFDAVTAKQYAHKPEAIANRVYSNRYGNGNEASGDGYNYRGHGMIMLTFKGNYRQASKRMGVDLVSNPELASTPQYAALVAGYFWNEHNLNANADRKEFTTITRKIAGNAARGAAHRNELYALAIKVLSDGKETDPEPDKTTKVFQETTKPAIKQTIEEPTSKASPIYPYNTVYQSKSGHIVEFDDTPDAERINIHHKSGTYIEVSADGSIVYKTVAGQHNITSDDLDAFVGGNKTVKIDGTVFESVGGDWIVRVGSSAQVDASSAINLNTPVVTFSNDLEGDFARVQSLEVSDGAKMAALQVDSIIDGTCLLAVDLVEFGGLGSNFSIGNLANSLNFTSEEQGDPTTGTPEWITPVIHKEPVALGAVTIMGFEGEFGDKVLAYSQGGSWYRVSDNTAYTPYVPPPPP